MPRKNLEDRRQYNAYNKESIKLQRAQYWINNKEGIKQYRQNNVDNLRDHRVQSRQDLKLEILTYYGCGIPNCVLCGDDRIGANNVDHALGGGKKHCLQLKAAGETLYKWLKKQHFPLGYRTLCANCNWKEHLKAEPSLSATSDALYNRERRIQIRLGILAILGDACVECGCTDLDVLTVEHINGDGADHRREVGGEIYRALFLSDDFTTRPVTCLCRSCNSNAAFGRD